ncbi:DUF2142 domain-containing protein [Bifidobacterium aemilianum]|nr:DUF2142 domain-containing protein [Bifidobacterium aemilianum]
MSRKGIPGLKPEWVFLILALMLAIAAAAMVPMGAGLDEPAHMARIEQLADGKILPQPIDRDSVDRAFTEVYRGTDQLYGGFQDRAMVQMTSSNMVSYQTTREPYTFPTWTSDKLVTWGRYGEGRVGFVFSNTSINSPLAYLPQVLVFKLVRSLVSNVWWIMFAMRLTGLLVYVLTGFLCIRYCPTGKWILATVALLPNAVVSNSMVTADVMSTVCCFAFLTVLLTIWLSPGAVSRASWLLLAVSTLCLGLVKVTYLPLTLLILLLPAVRPELRRKRQLLGLASLFALAVLLFLLWYAQIHAINTGAMFSPDARPKDQVLFILTHPLFFARRLVGMVVASDLFQISDFGVLSMRGPLHNSGWILIVLFILAVGQHDPREVRLEAGRRGSYLFPVAFAIEFMMIVVLIGTAVYVQFDPYAQGVITGVQNRYFIPILPLLLMGIKLLGGEDLPAGLANAGTGEAPAVASRRQDLRTALMTITLVVSLIFTLANGSEVIFGSHILGW